MTLDDAVRVLNNLISTTLLSRRDREMLDQALATLATAAASKPDRKGQDSEKRESRAETTPAP